MGQGVLKNPSEPCGSYTPGLGPKLGRDHENPGILGPHPLSPDSSLASFREPLLVLSLGFKDPDYEALCWPHLPSPLFRVLPFSQWPPLEDI